MTGTTLDSCWLEAVDVTFAGVGGTMRNCTAGQYSNVINSGTGAVTVDGWQCGNGASPTIAGNASVTYVTHCQDLTLAECSVSGSGILTLRDNVGINPVGLVTVAVPASGTAVAAAFYDRWFYITAGASTCAVAVTDAGGASQTVATIPCGGCGAVRVPAGSPMTPTYSSAPTWTVQGL